MIDITKIAYFAGIMDGEGSFYIGQAAKHPKSFNSRLYVVNTDILLINWLKTNFKGMIYSRKSKKNPHWKEKFEWISHKTDILSICEMLLPYLIIKKEHAKVMINFRKTFDKKRGRSNGVPLKVHYKRLHLRDELRKLNK